MKKSKIKSVCLKAIPLVAVVGLSGFALGNHMALQSHQQTTAGLKVVYADNSELDHLLTKTPGTVKRTGNNQMPWSKDSKIYWLNKDKVTEWKDGLANAMTQSLYRKLYLNHEIDSNGADLINDSQKRNWAALSTSKQKKDFLLYGSRTAEASKNSSDTNADVIDYGVKALKSKSTLKKLNLTKSEKAEMKKVGKAVHTVDKKCAKANHVKM